jgi:hypothetical protein
VIVFRQVIHWNDKVQSVFGIFIATRVVYMLSGIGVTFSRGGDNKLVKAAVLFYLPVVCYIREVSENP